jgi:hypothetical protein
MDKNITNVSEVNLLPNEFELLQDYPNPFNPETNIRIAIPFESNVKMEIFNSIGERLEILTDKFEAAGYKNYSTNFKHRINQSPVNPFNNRYHFIFI